MKEAEAGPGGDQHCRPQQRRKKNDDKVQAIADWRED
jgi:hypothetical protein